LKKRSKLVFSLIYSIGFFSLYGCGGGGSDTSQINSNVSASQSSEICNTSYPDKITSTTRAQAAADIQCGSSVGAADDMLYSARSNCLSGSTSSADANYSNYLKLVSYATSVVSTVCGGSSGPALPGGTSTSTTTASANYGLYVLYGVPLGGARVVISGICSTNQPSVPIGTGSQYNSVYYQQVSSNQTSAQCKSTASGYGLG
jgi:hypothetical protein